MQAHTKVWLVSAALGLSACASGASDDADPKSSRPPSTAGSSGASWGDYNPYAGSRNGGGAGQPSKAGAPSSLGGAGSTGNAGSAGSAGNAGSAGSVTGAGAGGLGLTLGTGNSGVAGSAGANSGPSTDCPVLTRVRLQSGACVDRIKEFAVAKTPANIVTGSDGQVWFDDEGSNQLVQLDSEGRVLKHIDCDEGSSPRALIGGRDDALIWFTDARAKTLYRLTQSAKTGFDLKFTATAIALGDSDQVWATEAGHALYQVRPYVSITPYPEAPSNALVVGTDNSVWFPTGSLIARLMPAQQTRYFSIGNNIADEMCMGPDGALWFTDGRRHQIGRMELGGKKQTFDLPFGSEPSRIIKGPDGALWFTEQGGDKIGRITVTGELTQYPIPTSGGLPYALTVGGDRNIWFTEKFSGKIGRLLTD